MSERGGDVTRRRCGLLTHRVTDAMAHEERAGNASQVGRGSASDSRSRRGAGPGIPARRARSRRPVRCVRGARARAEVVPIEGRG